MRIEIRPAEGGADAQAFAADLGQAISKHSGSPAEAAGRTVVLHRL